MYIYVYIYIYIGSGRLTPSTAIEGVASLHSGYTVYFASNTIPALSIFPPAPSQHSLLSLPPPSRHCRFSFWHHPGTVY